MCGVAWWKIASLDLNSFRKEPWQAIRTWTC
jgi:hypothetical protein